MYMMENQNYIVAIKSNKICRCIGVLREKFIMTWLYNEVLVTVESVKSPVHVGYQKYCVLPMFIYQGRNTAIPLESNLNGEQLVLVTWRGYKMQGAYPSSHTYTEVRVISLRAVEIILPSYLGRKCTVCYSLQRRNWRTENRGCLSQEANHLLISIYFWSVFMCWKNFILYQILT
jgi:hypothetical protein